jgi:two-component sensor histidine kinase
MPDTLAVRSWTVPLRWLQLGSIVIPLALVVVAGAWLWRVEYRQAEELVTRNALLAAQYSLRLLSSQEQLLRHAEGLVTQMGDDIDADRLQAHFADLVAADPYSRGLALIDADGEVLASHYHARRRATATDRAYVHQLRDTTWPILVDRSFRQADGDDALVVAIRHASPHFSGIIVTAVDVDVLAAFYRTLASTGQEAAYLLRQDGMLLIRQEVMQAPIQLPPEQPVMQVIAGNTGPLYESTAVADGVTRLYATLQLADLPLYAGFGMPVAAIRDAWLRSMAVLVVGLVAASAVVLLLARDLDRRVQARLDTAMLAETRKAAEHREMLFEELNHRVKNNLQLVQSLLRLRGRGQSDEIREILDEVALRVAAIGELHAELNSLGGDLLVDLGDLLGRVGTNPALVPPERGVTVRCSTASLAVPVDEAIAAALITVEAVTNAIKHAFPDDRLGRIDIVLEAADDEARLSIADDGIGIKRLDRASTSSGLNLIEALARKLGGSLEVGSDGGTRLVVTFPRPSLNPSATS